MSGLLKAHAKITAAVADLDPADAELVLDHALRSIRGIRLRSSPLILERMQTRSLRASVIRRDGNICRICSEPVAQNDVHVDHIVPICRGGRSVLENLRVTHARCNLRKGRELQ